MPLTKEQVALLDQILDKGYATKTIKILGGKAEVTFSSMQGGEQMKVESLMKDIQGTPAYVIHQYSIKLAAQAIKSYHVIGKDIQIFTKPDDAEAFLVKFPVSIIDVIIQAQGAFEKELSELAKTEDLETNFTPTPSEEQKPS
jgi:hypothetical protein